MPATLFDSRYAGEESGWHKLGTVFGRPMSIKEAVGAARLDYKVFTTQTYFKLEGQEYPVDGSVAIYREPTPDDPIIRSFGTASKGYTPIQNVTVGEILEPISEYWPCVTAGALGIGQDVWYLLKFDETPIAGEAHKQYILFTNSHKPGKALITKWVDERVVCQNTMLMALGEKGVTISLRHSRDIERNFRQITEAMAAMKQAGQMNLEQLQALAELQILTAAADREMRQAIVEAAYPEPLRPTRALTGVKTEHHQRMLRSYELMLEKTTRYRVAAYQETDKLYDEFPRIARTPYAVVQGVLAGEDHRRHTAANAHSALFGQGLDAKQRAYSKALEIVR
jgi:phage/plasmid-like protein (TIGR03299 family)